MLNCQIFKKIYFFYYRNDIPMRFLFFLLITYYLSAQSEWNIEPPAGNLPTKIDKSGITVIPNGRFITPLGEQIMTAPHPYGLCLSHDGNTIVTANSGINPFSINIIRNIKSGNPEVQQVPEGYETDNGILEACFMGLAFSLDDNIIYVAGGQTNKIHLFDAKTGKKLRAINCAFKSKTLDYTHGYLGDMIMSKDGKSLYVVDQIGFRIVEIDLITEKIVRNIPTGRYPFGIMLTPDQSKLIVANVGVFEYKRFTDLVAKNLKNTAHAWPASKYGSKEMLNGDASKGISALGDPNDDKAFSVWVYDRTNFNVLAKVKTGTKVGELVEDFPAVGGSSPNSLVATDDKIFVSNGSNDNISVIEINDKYKMHNIDLQLDKRLGKLKGSIPFGLCLSPDQSLLLVAESGINALAVIDTKSLKLKGRIPTAWFPAKIQIGNDNKSIYVANAKGYGSGPNGGQSFKLTNQGSYIGNLMNGTVSKFQMPDDEILRQLSQKVLDNNFIFSPKNASKSVLDSIKYIVFIAKENRTYDEVFGQIKNGNGDPSMARFGENVNIKDKNGKIILSNINVMPNHLALARKFSMADNYYCDSDVSADGHRWLVNTYPNEWVETSTAASYGGRRDLVDTSAAPGNLALIGASGAIYPEDYNEAGSMWEHLERHGKDFFNFGFGVEMADAFSDSTMKYNGELYTVNYPLPAPLFDKSSKTFPTYNMAIPDQFRASEFMREFKEKWTANPLPNLITLMLPNDHGTGPRPKAGFPYSQSYQADNDLALGRTVEFLSKTKYWKNMLIVVTEDDPQGGVDHVDAHRSLLVAISPYVKKDYVSKVHYSFGSIFKTFWDVMNMPYLNQYDAGACNMVDMFTDKPDFTTYSAIAADKQIFDPQKALDPFSEKFDWKAFSESEEMDKTETMQKRRADDDKLERKIKRKGRRKRL